MSFADGTPITTSVRARSARSGIARSACRAAVAVIISALVFTSCSGAAENLAPQPNPAPSLPADSTSSGPGGDEDSAATPSAEPSLPPDPKAPARIEPVRRAGAASQKRVSASSAGFDQPLSWKDGVRITVVELSQGVAGGVGAGSTPGAPTTTFRLRLTNGSSRPLDVSSVVLTTVYGSKSRRVAAPVYGEGTADFAGVVAPGQSSSASYAFSIPAKNLDAVSVTVDLDGRHAPGSFRGSVR